MGKMTHLLDENISGNDLIKIYNAQKVKKINFFKLLIQFVNKDLKLIWLEVLIPQLLISLLDLSLACVVYFSSTYLVMSAGDFLAYFTAMGMLVKPAKDFN